MTWTNLYSDIAEIFGDLAGDDRRDADVAWRAAHQREKDRERWREAKRRDRARRKRSGNALDRTKDQRHYAKRYATDAAFRERRKAYWHDYDNKRRNRKRAAKGQS